MLTASYLATYVANTIKLRQERFHAYSLQGDLEWLAILYDCMGIYMQYQLATITDSLLNLNFAMVSPEPACIAKQLR